MFDYEILKLLWWGIIGFLLIAFTLTDGMDMGVGGLLPFIAKDDLQRRVVINTVGAHWDGNQVWFITAGASLFAAWPMVYATAFSGFYFAMMLTLFCLFLRPLAFDYRSKIESTRWRNNWDWALFVGSMVPPLVFGIAFGNLMLGVPFSFDELMRVSYSGSFLQLFSPFALLCAVVSVTMVLLHGATWLVMRTDDVVARRAATVGTIVAPVLALSFIAAGLMIWLSVEGYVVTSVLDTMGLARPTHKQVEIVSGAWLNNYATMPLLWALPATAICMSLLAMLLMRKRAKSGLTKALAFVASSLTCTGIIATAGSSMFPFVLPSSSHPNHSLLLWDAVSSETTLAIMLIVVAVFIPLIISYTAWCYIKMWRTVTVTEITQNTHTAY